MRVNVNKSPSELKVFAKPLAILAIATAAFVVPAPSVFAAPTPPTSTLTSTQLSTIQSQIQQALAGISPSLTGLARTQAIEAALSQIAQADALSMGAGALSTIVADAIAAGIAPTTAVDAVIRGAVAGGIPGSVAIADAIVGAVDAGANASNVAAQALATAANIPIPPGETGVGMGMAAADLSTTNVAAAKAIGQSVANEGTALVRTAYTGGVLTNGGSIELADLSNAYPLAVGETGVTGVGNNNNSGANGNQGNDTTFAGNANNTRAAQNQNLPPCAGPSCT